MDKILIELTRKLSRKSPAPLDAIETVQQDLGVRFPIDYIEWMLFSNGGSGEVGEHSYLLLWPIEKLVTLNAIHRTRELTPGLALFGSDGGGEGFAFDTRQSELSIVQVPFVGIKLDFARRVGTNLKDFLQYLADR